MNDIPVYTRSSLLVWSCRLVTLVWGLLGLAMAAMLSVAADLLLSIWWFVSILLMAVATGVAVIALEYRLRCDSCKRRFMFEDLGSKHRQARRRGSLTHWTSSVLDVLLSKSVTCMYCGQTFRVEHAAKA